MTETLASRVAPPPRRQGARPEGVRSEGGPLWLLRGQWPLFAWAHEPGGRANGAVVLCPPLLGEHLPAQGLQRLVACALARRGLLAVRFDYEGTGDSGGPSGGPGRAAAWLDGVDQAVALARSRCDGPLTLLGVRSGALLAAQAAVRRRDVDVLVLWDPWQTGRAFLRRQRALQALRLSEAAASGEVEVPGFTVDAPTAEAIESFRLPGSLPVRRALQVARPKTDVTDLPLAVRLGSPTVPAPTADVVFAMEGELEAYFEVDPLRRQMPVPVANAVVDWVTAAVDELTREDGLRGGVTPPDRPGRLRVPSAGDAAPATVATAAGPVTIAPSVPGEVTVTERAVVLGPHALFGIETAPSAAPTAPRASGPRSAAGGQMAEPPTVLFLSSATDSHVGPARLWVILARRLAGVGIRCVRVDLSGLGDSPARPGRPEGVIRAPEAFDDVAEVVEAVGGPRATVLVGLCSGAYQALESALELTPLGVVGINPLLRFTPPEIASGEPLSPRRRLCEPRAMWVADARRAVPEPVGRMMASTRRMLARARPPRGTRTTWARALASAGVGVYCVCGDDEARQLLDAGFTADHMRLDVLPGLDHGLTVASHREIVLERVSQALQSMVAGLTVAAHDATTDSAPGSSPGAPREP